MTSAAHETTRTGTRSVLLRFNPEDYEQFARAILQHGGTRTGRGLRDQEKALMRIIGKAMAYERGSSSE